MQQELNLPRSLEEIKLLRSHIATSVVKNANYEKNFNEIIRKTIFFFLLLIWPKPQQFHHLKRISKSVVTS